MTLSWNDIFSDVRCAVCRRAKLRDPLCGGCDSVLPTRVRWHLHVARGSWFIAWWRLACSCLRTGRIKANSFVERAA